MKTKVFYFAEFLAFIVLFFILDLASINGKIFPFAFPMLFALAWANQKVWLLAPAYIISGLCTSFTATNVICLIVTVFALVLPYYIHVMCKKRMKKWELFSYCIIGQVATISFQILNNLSIYIIILNIVIGLLFL